MLPDNTTMSHESARTLSAHVSRARDEYHDLGFTVLRRVLPEPAVWSDRLLKHERSGSEPAPTRIDESYQRYSILDRFAIDKVLPAVGDLYRSLVPALRQITTQQIVESPYPRSAYYMKIYHAGGMQAWHQDSNGVTVLLYLTSHHDSGGTVIRTLRGTEVTVQPEAGAILLMQGRRCTHRADVVTQGPKVLCPFNYYEAGAVDRPPEIDDFVFGTGPSAAR
jgi:hypothetical protein